MTSDNPCWPGYEPVKGKKPNSKGSCRPSAESNLKPAEKEFRGKRKEQLDKWAAEHPGKPRSAAQHLAPPKKKAAGKKAAPRKSAAKKATAKKSATKTTK